jgi:hypothetical protein
MEVDRGPLAIGQFQVSFRFFVRFMTQNNSFRIRFMNNTLNLIKFETNKASTQRRFTPEQWRGQHLAIFVSLPRIDFSNDGL